MRTAMILSGCGVRDGAEIHESVCAMYCLEENGHGVSCFAPDRMQSAVIDHFSGARAAETRNILAESARIARGNIRPLTELCPESFDAIVIPGGMGAILNFCDGGADLSKAEVCPDIADILLRANKARCAIGLMCIAPCIAAHLFPGAKITLGDLNSAADACRAAGAHPVACETDEACVDETYRIVTVAAYMRAKSIVGCMKSAKALVKALENLVGAG